MDGVDFTYYRRADGDFCGSFEMFPSVVIRADGLDLLFDQAREHLATVCGLVTSYAPTDFASVPLLRSTMRIRQATDGSFHLIADDPIRGVVVMATGPTREAIILFAARRNWSIV